MTISESQNEPRILRRLLAQRELYAQAKDAQRTQVFVTGVGGGLLIFMAVLWRASEPFAAFGGIVLMFLDAFYFDRRQDGLREKASAVRDSVDLELFDPSPPPFLKGEGLHEELIVEAARAAIARGTTEADVRDWYPRELDTIPISYARLVSQKVNLAWDERLRARYAEWLLAVSIVTPILLSLGALALRLNMASFVMTIAAPAAPAVLWLLREAQRQRDAVSSTSRLSARSAQSCGKAARGELTVEAALAEARAIQTEITAWRRTLPPIPDWAYALRRHDQQEEMTEATRSLVELIRTARAPARPKPSDPSVF